MLSIFLLYDYKPELIRVFSSCFPLRCFSYPSLQCKKVEIAFTYWLYILIISMHGVQSPSALEMEHTVAYLWEF